MKIPAKLKNPLLALCLAALAVLAVKLALPVLLALAAALAIERPVRLLRSRAHMPRALASGLCVIVLAALILCGLYAAGARLLSEARGLCMRLPELADGAAALIGRWRAHPAAASLGGAFDALEKTLAALPERLSEAVISRLPGAAALAPGALLFAATAAVGAYFASASLPELKRFAEAQLSPDSAARLRAAAAGLRGVLSGWLRAQLLMTAATFVLLALSFLLLGVEYWLLLALLTALIDALPVLGTGTVLLPWAVIELLGGGSPLCIGLILTYGAVTILHGCIQPKLLGDRLGLHPLASLAAIYAGFRLWGVAGMIALPLATVCLCRLNDGGIIHLWKMPQGKETCTNDGNNIQYNCRSRDERAGRDEYASR